LKFRFIEIRLKFHFKFRLPARRRKPCGKIPSWWP